MGVLALAPVQMLERARADVGVAEPTVEQGPIDEGGEDPGVRAQGRQLLDDLLRATPLGEPLVDDDETGGHEARRPARNAPRRRGGAMVSIRRPSRRVQDLADNRLVSAAAAALVIRRMAITSSWPP